MMKVLFRTTTSNINLSYERNFLYDSLVMVHLVLGDLGLGRGVSFVDGLPATKKQ